MAAVAPETIRLDIDGMTCASCVARVEKALNGLDGVDGASVNLATEGAMVAFDPSQLEVEQLIGAVESIGYHAALPLERERPEPDRSVRTRLLVAAMLTVPVAVLGMIPAAQFSGWEWVALSLAAIVVLWAGWPFHRAAALNLRHRAATMDTLISLGTLAALVWSAVVLVAGLDADTYFEVGAVIVTLILLGRYLEARARRRSGDAIRKLLELGAKEARVLRDGEEVLVPVAELRPGDRFVVRPGEKIAADGIVEEGESALDQSMLTGESAPVEVEPGADVPGATINTYGRLVVRATKVGGDTALAQIARLVEEAQAARRRSRESSTGSPRSSCRS